MAGLLRVTRPSLLTLGVINGNASLTTLYPHNTPNHCQRHNPDDHQKQNVQITLSGTFKRLANSTGQACYDPAKISNEIPLPMPFSVICSPSHIMNTAPVTSVVTATKKKVNPGLYAKPEKLTDIANACTNASATVP